MLLVDHQIRALCVDLKTGEPSPVPLLSPFSEGVQIGNVISYGLAEAGYDLRLGGELWVFKNVRSEPVNPKRFRDEAYRVRMFDRVEPVTDEWGTYFILPPHGCALGVSLEYIKMPSYLKGRCVSKSTLARCSVLVNTTPIEPGWEGHLTIEISVVGPSAVMVFSQEGIAQVEFEQLSSLPTRDYAQKKGKYQNQGNEPVPARVKD